MTEEQTATTLVSSFQKMNTVRSHRQPLQIMHHLLRQLSKEMLHHQKIIMH